MTALNQNETKRIYISPQIECIPLDNEIAMQLLSPAVSVQDEVMNNTESGLINPFKTDIA